MTGVLFYQPSPRWPIGAALGAAALIHLAAVGLASIYSRERINEILVPGPPVMEIAVTSPPEASTPPPDTVAPTPTLDTTDKLFAEENPTPPPIRPRDNRRVAPIAKVNTSSGSLSLSSAKIVALNAPRPEYPYEARRQRITGSGIVAMTVDPATGRVTDASMWQSTGSPYLDNAAMTGFRKWRFKPGSAFRIKSPITYTLTGAAY